MKFIKSVIIAATFVLVSQAQETKTTEEAIPAVVDTTQEDMTFWNDMNDYMYYSHSIWVGMQRGLFPDSSSRKVVAKPSPKCFGSWITKEVHGLDKFVSAAASDFWSV